MVVYDVFRGKETTIILFFLFFAHAPKLTHLLFLCIQDRAFK